MNRRFSLAPPKQTLATVSGIRILPSSVPSGAWQCTPSPADSHKLPWHRRAGRRTGRTAGGEHLAAAPAICPSAGDLEAPHVVRAVRLVRDAGVDDVQQRLVGRERQTVGLHEVVGDDGDAPARRVEAVDVAGADLARRCVAFVVGVDAVARVGEPDAAVGLDHHVVGRVETLAVEAIGQHGARCRRSSVREMQRPRCSHDTRRPSRSTVWPLVFIDGCAEHRHRAVGLVPAQHAVVRNVGPHQVAPGGEPGRPLGPAAAGVELLDVHVGKRQRREARIDHLEAVGQFDSPCTDSSRSLRQWRRPRPYTSSIAMITTP